MPEVVLTDHGKFRLMDREIDTHEIKQCAKNGRVTKTLKYGKVTKQRVLTDGKTLEVVVKSVGNKIIVITAYII